MRSEVLADHKQGAELVDYTIALAQERGAAPEELSTLAAFKTFHDKHTVRLTMAMHAMQVGSAAIAMAMAMHAPTLPSFLHVWCAGDH
jgi:hypothetical protein